MLNWYTKYLTIPFMNKGRSFAGCDCFGLVKLIYKDFNIAVPEFEISCDDTRSIVKAIKCEVQRCWIRIDRPEKLALVVMATDMQRPGLVNHIGVGVDDHAFIHAFKKIGVSLTAYNHLYFGNCIKGFYVLRNDPA